jgi:adenosylcobinamide-phosphate synthase
VSDIITVMVAALILDRVLGDPPDRFHTTAWIGRSIAFFQGRLSNTRGSGAVLLVVVAGTSTAASFAFVYALWGLPPLGLMVAALVLKLQVGWMGLKDHALPVADALEAGDIEKGRVLVGGIVGRDTGGLTRENIISASIETTGENLPDSVISPLLYYAIASALWGVPAGVCAAVFYRGVNTLDAMVGYRKEGLENIGYFSARADDALNYLPARISALLIASSAALLGHSPHSSLRAAFGQHSNTPSPNGGWPMAAMAGALGVRLLKPGVYTLGDPVRVLDTGKMRDALRIVDGAVLIFAVVLLAAAALIGV